MDNLKCEERTVQEWNWVVNGKGEIGQACNIVQEETVVLMWTIEDAKLNIAMFFEQMRDLEQQFEPDLNEVMDLPKEFLWILFRWRESSCLWKLWDIFESRTVKISNWKFVLPDKVRAKFMDNPVFEKNQWVQLQGFPLPIKD